MNLSGWFALLVHEYLLCCIIILCQFLLVSFGYLIFPFLETSSNVIIEPATYSCFSDLTLHFTLLFAYVYSACALTFSVLVLLFIIAVFFPLFLNPACVFDCYPSSMIALSFLSLAGTAIMCETTEASPKLIFSVQLGSSGFHLFRETSSFISPFP